MGNVVCIKCKKQLYPLKECLCDRFDDINNELEEFFENIEKKESNVVECPHCKKLILL